MWPPVSSRRENLTKDNDFGFYYQFVLPRANKDIRSLHPIKLVKREYWLLPGISLVGIIGGTLGMFVGFSFKGAFDWVVTIAIDIWIRFKN